MTKKNVCELGKIVFSDIDENEYSNELYETILYNYAIKQLNLSAEFEFRSIRIADAEREWQVAELIKMLEDKR